MNRLCEPGEAKCRSAESATWGGGTGTPAVEAEVFSMAQQSSPKDHQHLHEAYESGPTACMASPEVIRSIRAQVAANSILSLADARLANRSGLLAIPPISRSGFNDEVIYPPDEPGSPLLASARRAQPTKRFSLEKKKGQLNCLVLLVDFSDNKGTTTPAHFQTLLFDPANSNSMHSYYKSISFGGLSITGQVTDWIRASKPYSYYANGQSGTGNSYPKNTPGLLAEVLKKYTQQNSLAPFDVNGDGYIDGLFLVHAGGGAEGEPDERKRANMIWSHKWTLPTPFTNAGVRAYAYFTAPEDGRLGVFAHEFGHFLGLPDLYDSTYRSQGIGDWCLMAGGSWNGGGDVPARMSAWCLATLGWIKPTNVTAEKTLQLSAIEGDSKACFRVWKGGKASKEYFLIENRQKAGRDKELPSSGLAVWHVDETQSDNTNPLAYRVGLVQADGKRDLELNKNQGDGGDVFPGSKKVTSVSGSGMNHPNLRANDGTATSVELSNIKMQNGIVSVKVKV